MTGCTPAQDPCEKECSGKEPNETGCDEGATDLIHFDGVVGSGTEGSLSIRMADPAICKDIYWARFIPSYDPAGPFEVIFKINGEVVSIPSQKSDPEQPYLSAWTKAYQAFEGDEIAACVIPVGQTETCVTQAIQ